MSHGELIAASHTLLRPCVFLKWTGPAAMRAGYWGASGVVPPPKGAFRHWLSFDCRFLPAGLPRMQGILSVYSDEDDGESGFAGLDPKASLPERRGKALFAQQGYSLPPPDALDAENDEAYIRLWQATCPLYTGGVVAVLGGWHFPWPDGDWEELRSQPLLVWTLEDSEPWIELWAEENGLRVRQRVT